MREKQPKEKKLYSTDMDKVQKELARLGSGSYFKPKEGKNYVRILPPMNNSGLFYHEATLHYGLKRDGKNISVPYTGESSPVMALIKKLEKEGPEGAKLAKRLAPRTKYYANVIDRSSGKVQVWGFSKKILSSILSAMGDPDLGDITDPEDGHDLVVERSGQNLETKYEIRVRPKPSHIGEDVDLDQMKDLETLVDDMDDDEIEGLIDENFGNGASDEEEEEDLSPKKKKKVVVDEDDDEEDEPKPKKKVVVEEEDDDDDEEDEPKPKKKPAKAEDDDEEDEEPKPKAKKRAVVEDDEEDEIVPIKKRKTYKKV